MHCPGGCEDIPTAYKRPLASNAAHADSFPLLRALGVKCVGDPSSACSAVSHHNRERWCLPALRPISGAGRQPIQPDNNHTAPPSEIRSPDRKHPVSSSTTGAGSEFGASAITKNQASPMQYCGRKRQATLPFSDHAAAAAKCQQVLKTHFVIR